MTWNIEERYPRVDRHDRISAGHEARFAFLSETAAAAGWRAELLWDESEVLVLPVVLWRTLRREYRDKGEEAWSLDGIETVAVVPDPDGIEGDLAEARRLRRGREHECADVRLYAPGEEIPDRVGSSAE